jgi:SAM-dependent methyltransferase
MGWRQRWNFWKAYLRGKTPWDTLVTPPELERLILAGGVAPGRAVDLGCGTGTNVIFLASHGWEVVGVDFVPQAILQARQRLTRAPQEVQRRVSFHVGDVTRWRFAAAPFDLALDIGCLHALSPAERAAYAAELERHTNPGARFLLYARGPQCRAGHAIRLGLDQATIEALLQPAFALTWAHQGEERGKPSGWYLFERE